MERVEPICKRISSLTEVRLENLAGGSGNSGVDEIRRPTCDTTLRFTPLSFRHFPAGASPAEITKLSMDKSQVLEDIMARSTGLP